MKYPTIVLAFALFAGAILPALAGASLDVPIVPGAPAGSKGAVADLGWDPVNNRSADEAATVHVYSDGITLFVRFDAPQREVLVGGQGGDFVAIELWPSGASGDYYQLGVNLDGTHTFDSTANTANWAVEKSIHIGGYNVTMKIPMSVVTRPSTPVLVQFSREIAFTGGQQIWSHNGSNGSPEDVAQAGTMILKTSAGSTEAFLREWWIHTILSESCSMWTLSQPIMPVGSRPHQLSSPVDRGHLRVKGVGADPLRTRDPRYASLRPLEGSILVGYRSCVVAVRYEVAFYPTLTNAAISSNARRLELCNLVKPPGDACVLAFGGGAFGLHKT